MSTIQIVKVDSYKGQPFVITSENGRFNFSLVHANGQDGGQM